MGSFTRSQSGFFCLGSDIIGSSVIMQKYGYGIEG
jgi:hypothetical protein